MMQMNRGEFKVTQYRKEVVPSAQKSEAEKSTEMDLSFTIFERFYGQICLQKLLKYSQTQLIFAKILLHFFGLMVQPPFYIE